MPLLMNRDDVLVTAIRMLERCAQCARRSTGGDGAWVLLLNEPRPVPRANADGTFPNPEMLVGVQFMQELAKAAKAPTIEMTEVEVPEPDPMVAWNKRPPDPKWIEAVEQLAQANAQVLQAFVVLVAVQEGGKMCFATGGDDLPGAELDDTREAAKDMPRFLRTLADVTERMQTKSSGDTVQ